MAYCDVTFADQYLTASAFSSGWESLDSDTKTKYLETASRLLHRFCFFYDENTGEPFRYDTDAQESEIPDFLRDATCEEALYLVNLGKDPTQADKKTTLGILSTDGTVFSKGFAADVICIMAQTIVTENGGDIMYGAVASQKRISFGSFEK